MGADWTAINTGLTDLDIRVLAIDPVNKGILYAVVPAVCSKPLTVAPPGI